jgi:uncharacterized protein (DUF433 family)
MPATLPTNYPHIAVDGDGVARVAGTRLKVTHLASAKRTGNWTAEELATQFPPLSLAQVYAALAYYYDHQTELDEAIRADAELAEELRPHLEDGELRAKLAGRLSVGL